MTDTVPRFAGRRMLAAVLAPLLCLHANTAQAVQQWSKAGHWQIYMDPGDNCFAVDAFEGNWIFGLSLTSERRTVAILSGALPYDVGAQPDLTWTTSDGTSFSGGSLVSAVEGGKRVITLASADFLSKMEVATSVRIDDANGKLVSFALTDMAPAVAELRRCMGELIKLDIGTGLPAATKPVPNNLSSAITSGDYPAAALRAQASGQTSVALTISAHGMVSDCSVTASSGNVDLDAATCRLMQRRARFTPATDAAGKATGARYGTSINWQLPPN